MNKFSAAFIILFVASIFGCCENIQKFDPQFFEHVSRDVHGILSNMFKELQLSEQFQEADRFRLLWIMHNNLNRIAQNYFKTYVDIVNASIVDVDNKTVNSLATLNNVIEEMAQEENIITVYNGSDAFNLTDHLASHEQSMMYILDFTKKFENFTISGILDKALNVKRFKKKQKRGRNTSRIRYKRKRTKNLKIWRPPSESQEDDDNMTRLLSNIQDDNITQRISQVQDDKGHVKDDNRTRRMSHVQDDVIAKFPFVASVHVLGEFVCAGAILSNFAVITAASCLHFVYQSQKILHDNKSLKVRVGSEFLNKFGLTVSAGKVVFHPSYNPMTLDNNLAIMKLKWSITYKWKSKNVMRVGYGTFQKSLSEVLMVGWGDKDSIPQVDRLSVTNMDIVDIKKCRNIYTEKYVNSKNFCGAILKRGPQAPCQRDIGSPAIVGNLLVGVVSYGPSVCAPPSAPTVYTDLSTYSEWINTTLSDGTAATLKTSQTDATLSPDEPKPTKSSMSSSKSIHFRQSLSKPEKATLEKLKSNILEKAKYIVNPLQNTYPEAVKLLSLLLKQLVSNDLRATERDEDIKKVETEKKETKKQKTKKRVNKIKSEESSDVNTPLVVGNEKSSGSDENVTKKPGKRDGFDEEEEYTEPTTKTTRSMKATTPRHSMGESTEIDYSEEMDTDDFYFSQNEGLSISVENNNDASDSEVQTVSKRIKASKPSSKKTKNKENKNNKPKPKKDIKNFKELESELEKEVNAKQEERLRKIEIEAQQTKQKSDKEESDSADVTKTEIEEMLEEVKNSKKNKHSLIRTNDKKAAIKKLIEEVLRNQETAKTFEQQTTKVKPLEPQIDYNERNDEASSDSSDSETQKPKAPAQMKTNPKKKLPKPTEGLKNKKKPVKTTSQTKTTKVIAAKVKHLPASAADVLLSKNFKIEEKFMKKNKKPTTTPKTNLPKMTRVRAVQKMKNANFEFHLSQERDYSASDELSAENLRTLFENLQKTKHLRAGYYEEESPMILPTLTDFELATKDRLVLSTPHRVMRVNTETLDNEQTRAYNKKVTKGIMIIDDLNIDKGISEEWAFRRSMPAHVDTSLEVYVKAGEGKFSKRNTRK